MNTPPFDVTVLLVAGTIAVGLLIFFLISFLILYQKKQVRYAQDKADLKAQYEQEILTSQLEVQNATLQNVSQELHDNVGQLLSVVRINLNVIEESTIDDENRTYVEQANELVARAIGDLRSLAKSLDGDFVEDFGLSESIAQELRRIRQTRKFGTELQVTGEGYKLGFQREIVLYRIVQEVLNNAIKHSEATQLTVQLQYAPEVFRLTVIDNGKGFSYPVARENEMDQSGAGLRNIQRRAALIGGTCEWITSPGGGTNVTITLSNQAV